MKHFISMIFLIFITSIVIVEIPETFGHHSGGSSDTCFRFLNSISNGLNRHYFPKDRDFGNITDKKLIHAMKRLYNRPRKRLGYKTPNEVFFGMESTVALNT